MTLSISVLGPLEVTGPRGPIVVRARRERMVLTALSLWAGDVVSIDRLAEVVWGDDAPRTGAKVVQNVVLRLRRALGVSTIGTNPGGYVLCVERDAVDLHRFDRLWREARAALVAGRLDLALDLFTSTCALWRGAPLYDIADHTAAVAAAARLREQYHDAMEELTDLRLGSGQHDQWLPTLEAMVVEEPLRERRWGQLMMALHRCGRQADALRAFQRARAALDEVGLAPGGGLRSIERSLSAAQEVAPPSNGPAVHGNVTVPLTAWIGSPDELRRRVLQLSSSRLTTLTGPGGVGKTRLAIELALAVRGEFPGGTWFVDLAPVGDAATVVDTVAGAFGVPTRPATPTIDALVGWLDRGRTLVIVDNCEHVIAPVAALVTTLLARCADTTVLLTSREPLALPGELVVVVPPMRPNDAYELFCERARASDDTILASDLEHGTIVAICDRLDRIPLAIELAAVRIRSRTAADVLAALDDRFSVLQRAGADDDARHRTMLATVTWSYRLLDERARTVFDRASVFSGGFDLDAARAVLGDDHLATPEVDAIVDDLVRKSMLTIDRRGDHVRYGLLETLRQFGERQLLRGDDAASTRDRHVAHYLGVARRALGQWASPEQAQANATFAREWNNLRAALQWATRADSTAAEALIAATAAFAGSKRFRELEAWGTNVLGSIEPQRRASPITYGWMAHMSLQDRNDERAVALAEAGIDAAARPDHPATVMSRTALVHALRALGQHERAHVEAATLASTLPECTQPEVRAQAHLALIERAFWNDPPSVAGLVSDFVSWSQTVGAPSIRALAAFSRGRVHMWLDEPADAEGAMRCYTEGLRLAREVGDILGEILNTLGLAITHLHLRTTEAPAACRRVLAVRVQLGDRGVLLMFDALVAWFLANDALEPAALIAGFLESPLGRAGDRPNDVADRLRRVSAWPGGTELLARGGALTLDEAVAHAIEHLDHVERRLVSVT